MPKSILDVGDKGDICRSQTLVMSRYALESNLVNSKVTLSIVGGDFVNETLPCKQQGKAEDQGSSKCLLYTIMSVGISILTRHLLLYYCR